MMLKLIRKRKRNWLGHWLRRNCLLKDALEGMENGRRVRGRRRYQIIDDIKIFGSYVETKRKAENRKDWRKLGLHSPSLRVPTYLAVEYATDKWNLVNVCSPEDLEKEEPIPPYTFSNWKAMTMDIYKDLQTTSGLKRATSCAHNRTAELLHKYSTPHREPNPGYGMEDDDDDDDVDDDDDDDDDDM
ncbi:hypothetical protein ANN_21347 [Periplaneta americana]|uniref:Uncharacterized protein n=1 Tax=Periplaneta americana TaxID=6978 RepID=A0ABQ8SFW3_PERAM|nr:hypothetical protein ANN_21347 [Periplaneta americana]